jgi:DNA invertase Pin-like site-specific DNA recombinase
MKKARVGLQTRLRTDAWTACYLRVSTTAQTDASQVHEVERYLVAHGVEAAEYYSDQASGANLARPEFERLQRDVLAGKVHTVIVYKLDRLARSLRDGIAVLCDWLARGVRIVSITQQLDFAGATGKLIASVLLAVAEMEREAIVERTVAGLAAARARGVRLGRPPGTGRPWLLAKRKIDPLLARSLRAQGVGVAAIAAKFNCSKTAVHYVLKKA